jgi:hypothetical protein
VAASRLPTTFLTADLTSADTSDAAPQPVAAPSFLIDLANWPSSGQIGETLAKLNENLKVRASVGSHTVHDMLILRDLGIRGMSRDDATKISLNLMAFPRL